MDSSLWIAFITGLTTGGLSCMAVQGGLLTGSLAAELEKDAASVPVTRGKASKRVNYRIAQPILLFLAAKLVAYTLLGALMGALGSVLSLTPVMRGVLQLTIGIFMIGNALRMFNVHPIFRFFNFEPPARVTRWLRRTSKAQSTPLTPLLLGAMTVLIPCGVTQTMLALAIASGNPLTGAMILLAFTIGTSPVFFGLTYLATRLSSLMEKYFLRIVAVALLILGFISIDTGLVLVGSPFVFSQIPAKVSAMFNPGSVIAEPTQAGGLTRQDVAAPSSPDELTLAVTNYGYEPSKLSAPANTPIRLKLVTQDTTSCAVAFTIPALNYQTLLDSSGTKVVTIPAQPAGSSLRFACSMGMFVGTITFQ